MTTPREVREVMSDDPVTVSRATPFRDLVELFSRRRISAAPVLDDHSRVVGVVSQTDLLPKEVFHSHVPTRRELLLHLDELEKAGGTTAADLMTSPAVTVAPGAGISEAARLMASHHIRRLPVIDSQQRLVGIVSQGDLLSVFLVPDEQLADAVAAAMARALPDAGTDTVTVGIANGVVTLSGRLKDATLAAPLVQAARAVEGVVDVRVRLDTGEVHRDRPQPDCGTVR